ncbi:hypothetical protein [Nocardia sp. BMG111209]|uniref:hypothetical protein n=1 Tax=Nocardia sp. BMG111209 TaxID=1160137 RepID=UPI0003661CB3|nr:hypothetical protein [Nocardia sp. BMG111209]
MNTDQATTGSDRHTLIGIPETGTPVVSWPDPSPLEHWWTEVMDGALLPDQHNGGHRC